MSVRTGLWILATLTITGLAAGPTSAQTPPDQFPPGEGRELTAQVCTACHGADTVTRRRMPADEWRKMVEFMVSYGAQADDKQQAEIVEYLSRALAPAAPAADKKPCPNIPR